MTGYNKIFLVLLNLLVLSCTGNPVTENEITFGNREISGYVKLGNNLDPEGVFVWLEGFNYSARTDENGFFKFVMPPAVVQSNSGISGAFNLYFYMANFRLSSIVVKLNRGEFYQDPGVFDSNGQLNRPVYLSQILRIKTVMMPGTVRTSDRNLIVARMSFATTEFDTVFVLFPSLVDGKINPIIFKNLRNEELRIFETTIAGLPLDSDTLKITNRDPVEVVRVIRGGPSDFSVGEYKVLPFVAILQDGIPRDLIKSIGQNVNQLGPGYLKLPLFVEGGNFQVTPSFDE